MSRAVCAHVRLIPTAPPTTFSYTYALGEATPRIAAGKKSQTHDLRREQIPKSQDKTITLWFSL